MNSKWSTIPFALSVTGLVGFSIAVFFLLPAGQFPAPARVSSAPGTAPPPLMVPRSIQKTVPETAVPPALSPTVLEQERAAAIRATIAALREECQRIAGGDWDRRRDQLKDYRTDLKARIVAATPNNPAAEGTFEARSAVLEGKGGFPLFESAPDHYLRHVVEPESLDSFRKEQPVAAGARWLRRRGIDVIFVPVPKMTEVYPEYFAEPCPSDRIVAPHIRQALLELLESDVEVIDLLPTFLEERDRDAAPLFLPADPHWAPRAQAIAARAIAARLQRYDFVKKARSEQAKWEMVEAAYPPASDGATYKALTPDQCRRADEIQPRSSLVARDGSQPQFEATAPVAFIGDSYNGRLMEQVGLEINMPVNGMSGGGHTTDAFKNFLRDPNLLKDCKVVVWLVCNSSLKAPWPIPGPIQRR